MNYPAFPGCSGLAAAVLLSGLAFSPAPAWAGAGGTLRASDITVKIEGQSTLHAWQVSASSVGVDADVHGGGGLADAVARHGLDRLDLVLMVSSLKSTEGGAMDKNMGAALQSEKFPKIQFHMRSYRLDGQTVTAKGDLSIHGETKPVTLTGLMASKGNNLTITGVYPLEMSDYGVKPPVMMFGTIRTADPVKIHFGFTLAE